MQMTSLYLISLSLFYSLSCLLFALIFVVCSSTSLSASVFTPIFFTVPFPVIFFLFYFAFFTRISLCYFSFTDLFWLLSFGRVPSHGTTFLNRPFGRSLRSFACTAHSAHSLRNTLLCIAMLASLCLLCSLAPFMGLLTHFVHPLVGQLKFMNMCSRCKRVWLKQKHLLLSLETSPDS